MSEWRHIRSLGVERPGEAYLHGYDEGPPGDVQVLGDLGAGLAGPHDQDRAGDPGADPAALAHGCGHDVAPTSSWSGRGSRPGSSRSADEVGSVGRRRLPGNAASAVPTPCNQIRVARR